MDVTPLGAIVAYVGLVWLLTGDIRHDDGRGYD
jgi:hypothetical protein